MKKKKILKSLGILIILALAIIVIFSIVKYKQTGNQTVSIVTSDKYYINDKVEAVVEINSSKIIEKGNIKVKLLDSNKKTVKKTTQKVEIDDNAMASISMELPNNLEPGKYYIEIIAKTNLGKDKVKKTINIQNTKDSNITITFDKGIYKPNDEVNYRALATYMDNDKPIEEDIKVSIFDGNGNRVYIKEGKTSDYGIISGTFKLAEEVNSGTYTLKLETKGQEYTKCFNVNPYVAPKYSVELTTDKANYLVGETAVVKVKAQYFFGENVKNASIKAKINENEFIGKTDENGEYSFEYKVEKTGKFSVSAQVIDESNYMIEENTSFSVGTGKFEIEVLPIYNKLIKGINNDIYIFTKKADGTPVKTYATVTINNIKRQVITNEKGIGKFTLTANDLENVKYSKENEHYDTDGWKSYEISSAKINISAKDMDENVEEKSFSFELVNDYKTVISTDSVKYNTGDDIELRINSSNEKEKIVYVCKNDKVIKMITTSEEKVKLNLGDTYGLIDIYILDNSSTNTREYMYTTTDKISVNNRKTIFIKPNKSLNISVETDKEEYSPKDIMRIKY
ncbi:MAG: MG2 domain-containing protein [Candidatus Scatovivens sp.]